MCDTSRESFNLIERPWMLFSIWHWKYARQYWLEDFEWPFCFWAKHGHWNHAKPWVAIYHLLRGGKIKISKR